MIKIVAEIGINHNGRVGIAERLIDVAATAGCDYVKFQKRSPEISVPRGQWDEMRSTPWGEMRYIDYKKRIEFGEKEYNRIDDYCNVRDISWFASVWDEESVDFMTKYNRLGGCMLKIPSAKMIDRNLLIKARKVADILIMSTGMSTEKEVEEAVRVGDPDVIMHTISTYPAKASGLNLGYIKWLKEKYPSKEIGYSGHEYGLVTTFAVVPLGATWIERHITLDHDMWGSDQMASIEPSGLMKLVKGIRDIESALTGYGERECAGSEFEKRKSLRGC